MVTIQNNQIFVPDLGIDKVVVFNVNENTLKENYKIESTT